MKKSLKVAASVAGLILSGYATQAMSDNHSESLSSQFKAGMFEQKVDNLKVIVDSSGSMNKTYEGTGYSDGMSKFDVEKDILKRMGQQMPTLDLSSGLRDFGWGSCLNWGSTELRKQTQGQTKEMLASNQSELSCAGGGSPIASAVEAATADLQSSTGDIALLILSDGYSLNSSPIPAVKAMKEQYGERLCIYSVWVGNENEQSGRYTLQQLTDIAGCGTVKSAADLASTENMDLFIAAALLNGVEADNDTDGDGVPNDIDQCPNTPAGAKVDRNGCWYYHGDKGALFAFDSAEINPDLAPLFDNAVLVMERNPSLKVLIEGHTDSVGPAEYNQKLSERRAISVKDYMAAKGIDPARMETVGLGESDPAASNDTEEGRAFNRRVEYEITER